MPPLQDALTGATEITKDKKEVDGTTFYLYDIDSPVSGSQCMTLVNYDGVMASHCTAHLCRQHIQEHRIPAADAV